MKFIIFCYIFLSANLFAKGSIEISGMFNSGSLTLQSNYGKGSRCLVGSMLKKKRIVYNGRESDTFNLKLDLDLVMRKTCKYYLSTVELFISPDLPDNVRPKYGKHAFKINFQNSHAYQDSDSMLTDFSIIDHIVCQLGLSKKALSSNENYVGHCFKVLRDGKKVSLIDAPLVIDFEKKTIFEDLYFKILPPKINKNKKVQKKLKSKLLSIDFYGNEKKNILGANSYFIVKGNGPKGNIQSGRYNVSNTENGLNGTLKGIRGNYLEDHDSFSIMLHPPINRKFPSSRCDVIEDPHFKTVITYKKIKWSKGGKFKETGKHTYCF